MNVSNLEVIGVVRQSVPQVLKGFLIFAELKQTHTQKHAHER